MQSRNFDLIERLFKAAYSPKANAGKGWENPLLCNTLGVMTPQVGAAVIDHFVECAKRLWGPGLCDQFWQGHLIWTHTEHAKGVHSEGGITDEKRQESVRQALNETVMLWSNQLLDLEFLREISWRISCGRRGVIEVR